jgi:hypothetical protein
MERDASKTRNSKKLKHDRRRARQRIKGEEVLPMRREDGTTDPTPHIASVDIATNGEYLNLGKGFVVRAKY